MPEPSETELISAVKGIRQVTLRQLVMLLKVYCEPHEGEPLVDFMYSHHGGQNVIERNGQHKTECSDQVLTKVKDVTKLFMQREGFSERTARDYAKVVEQIQKSQYVTSNATSVCQHRC